jgi:hypothetical protein
MDWKSVGLIAPFCLVIMIFLTFIGCDSGPQDGNGGPDIPEGPGSTSTITVNWNANHESLVNAPGGGYRVYYSTTPGFTVNGPGVSMKEVPYESGALSPTSTELTLEDGTWYIKVCACMDLKGVIISAPSVETSITLP